MWRGDYCGVDDVKLVLMEAGNGTWISLGNLLKLVRVQCVVE